MKGIIEKIKNNRTVSIIVTVIVVLLIIIGILFGTGVVEGGKLSLGIFGGQEAGVIESDLFDGEDGMLSVEVKEVVAPIAFSEVTFPVFADGDMFDYEGEVTACNNEIVWVTTQVPPTKAILNATLRKMFDFENDPNYIPTNFVGEQENLTFREAKIVNGIAMIYLDGEFNIENDCDAARPWIQLEETALKFDSVIGVQVFLNDELVR